MRKLIAFVLFATLVLTGCSASNAASGIGDFSFELPAGYSVAEVTDRNCSIVWDAEGVHIGGIELTELTRKDVTGKNSDNVMQYLMDTFHSTRNVEYIAAHWGNTQKILSVSLEKQTDEGEEEPYTHLFFEKEGQIYHIWLDKNIVDSEVEGQFLAITGVA